jgi:hypothetical protein
MCPLAACMGRSVELIMHKVKAAQEPQCPCNAEAELLSCLSCRRALLLHICHSTSVMWCTAGRLVKPTGRSRPPSLSSRRCLDRTHAHMGKERSRTTCRIDRSNKQHSKGTKANPSAVDPESLWCTAQLVRLEQTHAVGCVVRRCQACQAQQASPKQSASWFHSGTAS